ncbi:MAG: zinc-binding dehydrogenase [Ignavibacteria bacterium]
MKAVVLNQTGPSANLSENISIEEVPVPEISEDEILIKVLSASLNHRDLWLTSGSYSKIKLPVILGSDCAGIIHSTGKNVKELTHGDEVIINPGMNWGADENFQSKDFKILGMPDDGTLSEYVKVHMNQVFRKPEHLTFEEASAFPLAGVTAFRCLFKKAQIKKFDNVLITGAGGGVAALALIFASKAGANVYVTSSQDHKIETAISFGAKGGVNYSRKEWEKEILKLMENNIQIVIDGNGGENINKFTEICNYGARIVCYGATAGSVNELSMHKIYWKQIKLMGSTMGSPGDFADMLSFINENKIRPVIDKVFKMNDIVKAFERMDRSEQFGKIIVSMK